MIRLFRDVAGPLFSRPGRLFTQGAGMILGSCLFVLALGLGQTISAQVSERFDVFKATTVAVDSTAERGGSVALLDDFIPSERLASSARLQGLVSVSRIGIAANQQVLFTPAIAPGVGTAAKVDVVVVDPNIADTIEASVQGFGLNPVDTTTRRDVAIVGGTLAASLGIERPGQLVRLGASHLLIVGIISETKRLPDLLNTVLISEVTARHVVPALTWQPRAIVRTHPGAGEAVANSLAKQLRPDNPTAIRVTAPISPEKLQKTVSDDVRLLSIGAAVVVLLAGVFAAANLMLLNVSQRTPELGMRRALGASAWQVLWLVLVEALSVGLFAGISGTILGLWLMLAICIANGWAPVIGLVTIWIGMLAGVLGGALGGAIPAIVAARIQPAAAIRR